MLDVECAMIDPPEGRGGAGALAVWADAGFSFGGLGPLKSSSIMQRAGERSPECYRKLLFDRL